MLNDKTILVTGGTGSFGKQFARTTLKNFNPKRFIIYSRDELKQYLLRQELEAEFPEKSKCLRFFIGDVRDKDRLYRAFNGVDYVVHAAAMKQVPTCEYNPFEAVKTNIHGAQNIIDAALDLKVKKVVALSTDKAVNPINLYGGTKLVSDKLFIAANAYSGGNGTVFSIVRYGNVAGSRGSVIPFFRSLIEAGETELPITDYRMTRFWITLDQGIDLVYKALAESQGGETYISKIPSFKMTDLAYALKPDCTMKEVGIREGEKIHEVMLTRDDARYSLEFEKHFVIYPNMNWKSDIGYNKLGGAHLQQDFEYSSESNNEWLSIEGLRSELARLI